MGRPATTLGAWWVDCKEDDMLIRATLCAMTLFCFGLGFQPCGAAPVPISNPGFEADVLGAGGISHTITGNFAPLHTA